MIKEGEHREAVAIPLVAVILGIGWPTVALMIGGGAESKANMWKFVFYGIMLLGSAFLIFVIKIVESEGFFEQRESWKPLSRMTVHSPENTLLAKWLRDMFGSDDAITKPQNLFLISFIPSLFFGMLIGITGTFVSGIPTLTQGQITETAQLSLAVEPAVLAETLFINVVLFYTAVAGFAWLLWQKLGVSLSWSYIVAKTFAVPSITLLGIGYHIFRYGGSEASLLGVGFLFLLTNLFMALTDSMIPAYLIHANGNFFHKLRSMGLFTNEMMVLVTVLVGIVVTVVYTWLANPFGLLDGETG